MNHLVVSGLNSEIWSQISSFPLTPFFSLTYILETFQIFILKHTRIHTYIHTQLLVLTPWPVRRPASLPNPTRRPPVSTHVAFSTYHL